MSPHPKRSTRRTPKRATGSGGTRKKETTKKVRAAPAATPRDVALPIVGIGASAGGLDAFKKLFGAMPVDTGMAFVLIPHLDPTHESLMVELLAKQTAMPVSEASDGTRIAPDQVYIIPPNKDLAVRGGVLRLSSPPQPRGLQTAIDFFLRSLADDRGERSIGIILSGTGSHGTQGLKEIKLAGGMVMVQDPVTAEYDQMPRSAIATGMVDYVLSPERMPEALVQYVRQPYINGEAPPQVAGHQATEALNRILAVLQARTKYDFRCYRRNMLARRVQRRMGLCHVDSYPAYVRHLRETPDEVTALFKDLLIGVTGFFREPDAFTQLERQVVPDLVDRASADRTVRVWVPGCATGEEAYSIAILLMERFAAVRKPFNAQIFATDIDEESLDTARTAIYPASIAGDLTPARLQRFFVRSDEHHYQVDKQVREAIVFAPQNLISDAPFSRLDLISCRNLLIYLEPVIQEKVVSLFHFALNPDGCLLLGPSESIGRAVDLFEPISKKWRLYRRIGPVRREVVEIPIVGGDRRRPPAAAPEPPPRRPRGYDEIMQRALMEKVAPAALLVNRRGEVLCFRGPVVQYLEFPAGEPTQALAALARQGLRTKLRAACQRVLRDGEPVVDTGAQVLRNGGYAPCTIAVHPLRQPGEAEGLLLVTFADREPPPAGETAAPGPPEESAVVQQLEYELRATREDLQSTIEELESSNEELKASNEEVMSMNEELQSANEELETSKEELQSLNEELNTVNNQLEDKVLELDTANADLTSLLNSTQIATVFLDPDLRIKRFTPEGGKLLTLLTTDVGRPITDFAATFHDETLLGDCRQVLEKLMPREREIVTEGDRLYLRRIVPYRAAANRIDGVVVTFIDLTARREAEREIAASEASLAAQHRVIRAMVDDLGDGVAVCDEAGRFLEFSASGAELLGLGATDRPPPEWTEHYGLFLPDRDTPFPPGDLPLVRALRGERVGDTELFVRNRERPDGVWISAAAAPLRDDDGTVRGAVCVWRDLTARRRAEQGLRDSDAQVTAILNTAADAIITIGEDGTMHAANPATERLFGYSREELVGRNVGTLMPAPYRDEHDGYIGRYLRTGEARIIGVGRRVIARRKDGSEFPVDLSVSEHHDDAQRLFTGFVRDLTHTIELERRLATGRTEERDRLARELHDGLGGDLSGTAMIAGALHTQLDKAASPLAPRAAELAASLDRVQQRLRDISHGLMPVEAVPEGLMVALGELASKTSNEPDIACRFECEPPVAVSEQATANELFLIAQEAVHNAVHHGQPREIVVGLGARGGMLRLEISDDGVGFEEAEQHGGIGLISMRQRAALLHGRLTVRKRRDGGTVVRLTMPWTAQEPEP